MTRLTRLALAGVLIFTTTPSAHAQQPENRLSVSVGVGTLPELAESMGHVLGTVFTGASYSTEVRGTPVAGGIQYERFLSPRIALLGTAGMQRIRRDAFVGSEPRGTLTSTYTHALAGFNVHYLRGQRAGLYSGASAGLGLRSESFDGQDGAEPGRDTLVGLQVTALGMRVRRPLGAFVELGVGYRGMVAAGLSYEF